MSARVLYAVDCAGPVPLPPSKTHPLALVFDLLLRHVDGEGKKTRKRGRASIPAMESKCCRPYAVLEKYEEVLPDDVRPGRGARAKRQRTTGHRR